LSVWYCVFRDEGDYRVGVDREAESSHALDRAGVDRSSAGELVELISEFE
jgi:hypothetical protein